MWSSVFACKCLLSHFVRAQKGSFTFSLFAQCLIQEKLARGSWVHFTHVESQRILVHLWLSLVVLVSVENGSCVIGLVKLYTGEWLSCLRSQKSALIWGIS